MAKKHCSKCSKTLGLFSNYNGLCKDCHLAEQKRVAEEQERMEQERKLVERQRLIEEIPIEIRTDGLVPFAEKITGESPVRIATIARWPEAMTAERIGQAIGLNLLTSGFAGGGKRSPFGIAALTENSLWIIGLGHVWTVDVAGSSGTVIYEVEKLQKNIMKLDVSDLKTQLEYYKDGCYFLLKSKAKSHLVGVLIFPSKFKHPFTHPFFEYAPDNEHQAFEMARQIGIVDK
jgi:hypothetical protein